MVAKYEIINSANIFREDSGLGVKNPINIRSLLLKLKVLAVFKPLKSTMSGMAIKVEDRRFMLINTSKTVGHQRFTTIHELYHLCIQKDFRHMVCTPESPNSRGIEKKADLFASHVLIPDAGLLEFISNRKLAKNQISIGTLLEIEQYYMCSRKALLNRLKNMGLIDGEHYEKFSTNVIKNAIWHGLDKYLYCPNNKKDIIGDYGILSKTLYDKGFISESHYAFLMGDIGIDIDVGSVDGDQQQG